MNKKVLVIAVALMAVAMLALPMSAVSATKPEEITFYGFPFTQGQQYFTLEQAGKSDNWFMVWTDLPWVCCENVILPATPPPLFIPVGVFATGVYDGRWNLHGVAGMAVTHFNLNGVFTLEVTKWDGEPATGNLVILGVTGDKWVILSGEINGQTVHGEGTTEAVIGIILFRYTGTIHFDP